jgi:hypothetical protein
MENTIPTSNISFDSNLKDKIFQTAKVAGIAAIISLINTALGVITFFLPSSNVTVAAKEGFSNESIQLAAKGSVFSLVITVAINLLFFYYLYRFSRLSKNAIQTDNRMQLYFGLESLSGYFKMIAYLFVLLIIIFVGVFVFTTIGAMAK